MSWQDFVAAQAGIACLAAAAAALPAAPVAAAAAAAVDETAAGRRAAAASVAVAAAAAGQASRCEPQRVQQQACCQRLELRTQAPAGPGKHLSMQGVQLMI